MNSIPFRTISSRGLALAILVATCLPTLSQAPLAPSSMIQVPIVTTELGVPAATYNTATPAAACPSTTPGYLATNDGCPAAQTLLTYPYSVAIDASNDIAVPDYGLGFGSSSNVTIIYGGGTALGAALVAAKPAYNFTPMVGHAYLIGNSGLLKSTAGTYYCSGTSGTVALDAYGSGCPAQYASVQSRGVTFDANGNLFFGQSNSSSEYQGVKVLYVGGTPAANLITSYFAANCANWPVSGPSTAIVYGNVCSQTFTPKPGYVYSLSAPGDFVAIRGLVAQISSSGVETLYAADNGASAPETGLQAATSGNQIKATNGAGWVTYLLGNTTGGATVAQGDGGPVASAFIDLPTQMIADRYGNLYFLDTTDARIRVVYKAGLTPPLYIAGSTPTPVTTPQAGYVYSVAGGGASRNSPSQASALSIGGPVSLGMDSAGNLYFTDSSKLTWVEYQGTGNAVNIAGGATVTTYGSISSAPAAGVFCNGTTSGPTMTDAYGDGCPATEVSPIGGLGTIGFDSAGNFYMAEQRVVTGATAILRKYSYNSQFGAVATGSSATDLIAFTPYTRTSTYTPSFQYTSTGSTSTEFTDGGGSNCAVVAGANTVQTCTYNAVFTPAAAGLRLGSLTLSASGSTLGYAPLGGIGSGAQISIDPATQVTIGSGYTPSGVGVGQAGNAYLADSKTNSVFLSTGGATPALYATGFSAPKQIAVSGTGALFVADSGNNRIAQVVSGSPSNTVTTFLSSAGGVSLSKPAGVAVDAAGDLFIADTGNNRILEVPYDLGIYGTVSTLAFTGLNSPTGLALDAQGDLFVADSGNARVVELSAAGVQSTVTVSPALMNPVGVAVDPAGDLYIADAGAQSIVLVPAGSSAASTMRSSISGLDGLAADNLGDLYISAASLAGLSLLNRNQTSIPYPQTNIGQTSVQVFSLTNSGNAALSYGSSLDSTTDAIDFSVVSSTTNGCSTSSGLAVAAACNLTGIFQPQSVSAGLTDTVSFPASNAAGNATATLVGPAQLGLTYSFGSPGNIANTINTTLTATLATGTPSAPINGSIIFKVGGNSTTVPISGGTATLTLPLTAGVYTVTATYSGTTYTFPVTASVNMTVVTGTSSVALSIASPTGAITYGQAVVIAGKITTGNSTASPTGTVTFTVNNVPQTPVAYGATVSDTLNLAAGSYTVVASYSGDANYVPSQSSISFTVGRATPTITIVPTPNVGATNTITLTANLPAAPTYPTGNVSFSYGSTGIGKPVALSNGAASIATSTNILSSYAFTAVYSGDANFLPATVTVTAAPQLVLSATPSSLTTIQNAVGQVTLSLNSFYGYSAANVTFSCTGAPAYTVCDANPAAAPADQITNVPMQIFTSVSPLAVQSSLRQQRHGLTAALAGVLLLFSLPRVRRRHWSHLLALLALSVGLVAASGCGSSNSSTGAYATPTGSYSITIVANDGTTSYKLPFSLTVNPGYSADRPN